MKALNLTTLILTIIGGVNVGIYGLFGMDMLTFLFGIRTVMTNCIEIMIGLSSLYQLMPLIKSFDLDEDVAEVISGRLWNQNRVWSR